MYFPLSVTELHIYDHIDKPWIRQRRQCSSVCEIIHDLLYGIIHKRVEHCPQTLCGDRPVGSIDCCVFGVESNVIFSRFGQYQYPIISPIHGHGFTVTAPDHRQPSKQPGSGHRTGEDNRIGRICPKIKPVTQINHNAMHQIQFTARASGTAINTGRRSRTWRMPYPVSPHPPHLRDRP